MFLKDTYQFPKSENPTPHDSFLVLQFMQKTVKIALSCWRIAGLVHRMRGDLSRPTLTEQLCIPYVGLHTLLKVTAQHSELSYTWQPALASTKATAPNKFVLGLEQIKESQGKHRVGDTAYGTTSSFPSGSGCDRQ